ncbi:MAG: hypothetical protein ACE144_04800 [Thermodesulfobacteriota bacterium]
MKKENYVLIAGLIIIALIVIFPPEAYYAVREGNRIKVGSYFPGAMRDVDYARTFLYCGLSALATGVFYFIVRKK